MMYRLRVDLMFERLDIPEQAYEAAQWLLNRCIVPGSGCEEGYRGYIMVEKCFHDEVPWQECVVIRRVECPG